MDGIEAASDIWYFFPSPRRWPEMKSPFEVFCLNDDFIRTPPSLLGWLVDRPVDPQTPVNAVEKLGTENGTKDPRGQTATDDEH